MGALRRGPRDPDHRPRRGLLRLRPARHRYLDGLSALYCVNIGHGRAEVAQAGADQASELGFFTNWAYAHPKAIELAARIADARPRRPQPRLLHLAAARRRSTRRSSSAASTTSSPATPAATRSSPQARLPRHDDGRADRDRHPGRAAPFEPLFPGSAARAEHEPVPARGRRPGRGDPRADRVRGARDRLVRDPRAGAELRRLLRPARRLLPARARDLRRVRDPLHLRRGHLLVGPARRLVRRPALRLPARHHHDGQGPHLLLRADGRGDRLRPRRSSRSSTGTNSLRARHHVRRAPGRRGDRAGQPRRVRGRRTCSRTCAPTRPRFRGDARLPARHPDRRRRARHGLLLGRSSSSGPGDEGDLHRRRVRLAAARLPLARELFAAG